jgi:hypothetical protein
MNICFQIPEVGLHASQGTITPLKHPPDHTASSKSVELDQTSKVSMRSIAQIGHLAPLRQRFFKAPFLINN